MESLLKCFFFFFENKQTWAYYRLGMKLASRTFSANTGDKKNISIPQAPGVGVGGGEFCLLCVAQGQFVKQRQYVANISFVRKYSLL